MLDSLLTRHAKILAECAVAERLRRISGIELHPTLFNTPLIYGPETARRAMDSIYTGYLQIAREAGLPLLLTAPTWRLDPVRIAEAGVPSTINSDAVECLFHWHDKVTQAGDPEVVIGALTGPQYDCYRPDLAPTADQAEAFHAAQIHELSRTRADFLLAQTLPAVSEATGIARAIATTGKPYLISFCTGTDGRVLDGTPLPEAIQQIDQSLPEHSQPTGYFVNCTHPRFILDAYPPGTLDRLIGIQANASSRDVTRLDGSAMTVADPVDTWSRDMLALHQQHNVRILGGCCGTNDTHLRHLAGLVG